MSESYRVRAVEVYCHKCGEPYSHNAKAQVSSFPSIEEARTHLNSFSLWAAGGTKVTCSVCASFLPRDKETCDDIREQLKMEP